jgi:hypothetical protein
MDEDFISLENDWEPEAVAEGEAQAQAQPETQGPAPLAAPNGGTATGLLPGLMLPAPHSAAVEEAAAVPSDEQSHPDSTAAASAEEQLARCVPRTSFPPTTSKQNVHAGKQVALQQTPIHASYCKPLHSAHAAGNQQCRSLSLRCQRCLHRHKVFQQRHQQV